MFTSFHFSSFFDALLQKNFIILGFLGAQLADHNTEIGEVPRFPIETLIGGGGDCEDSSILVASLLKAADKKWDIDLVYMDGKNPTKLKELNHAAVWVDTGTFS